MRKKKTNQEKELVLSLMICRLFHVTDNSSTNQSFLNGIAAISFLAAWLNLRSLISTILLDFVSFLQSQKDLAESPTGTNQRITVIALQKAAN